MFAMGHTKRFLQHAVTDIRNIKKHQNRNIIMTWNNCIRAL